MCTRSMRNIEMASPKIDLCFVMEELQQLKEECHQQQHQEQEILALLTQRDESIRRLEEQLRLTSGESISNSLELRQFVQRLYKLKPDTGVSLCSFKFLI